MDVAWRTQANDNKWWKTHNKFQAPAAEIPLEDPQVVTEDNVNDDVFLYQAAVENRDDLHASEEDLALVGQDVEDGQELPNSQQQEEELPELSASTVVQTGDQGVKEWRPAVVHVLVWRRKWKEVASSSAAPEQN